MNDVKKQIASLQVGVAQGLQATNIGRLEAEERVLAEQMAAPDFWTDAEQAQRIAKQQAAVRQAIDDWRHLEAEAGELAELAALDDESMLAEIQSQLAGAQSLFDRLQFDLQFSGPYDDHDAIIRIYAGAGGTDAQDWAEMLQRMYLRWVTGHDGKAEVVEQSAGEEAGIKSATIAVQAVYAYGKLKSEHGVHRLVRLSPFNADNLRQTSFAMVEVLPQIDEPKDLAIDEDDLRIDVFRAGGHGGQSVNTTDSAVRITHVPTGIVVAIQNERSQLQNKETAMKILRSKLAQLQLEQHKERIDELRGPNQSAEWGNQIRNYVLHPYTLVKDTRTKHEEHDAQGVLDGNIDPFIAAYLQKGE